MLTKNQIENAAPYLTEGLIFCGEFRGYMSRPLEYEVKDAKGNPTGRKETMNVRQAIVEIQEQGKLPEPKFVELDLPRGAPEPEINAQKGSQVLVKVTRLKQDKYTGHIVIRASAIIPLNDVAPAREYTVNSPAPEATKPAK